MEKKIQTSYGTMKDYINFLAESNELKSAKIDSDGKYVCVEGIPESSEEAKARYDFWRPIATELSDKEVEVDEVEFVYQERDEKLPLPLIKGLAKKLGFNVQPKTREGEIKHGKFSPGYFKFVNNEKSLAHICTSEEEWKSLRNLGEKTDMFSTTYVLSVIPDRKYQVTLPLELISKLKFKDGFLETEFGGKK